MTFWVSKLVQNRKEAHCSGCQRIFPIGVSMFKEAGVFDGEFTSYKMCQICHAFWTVHHKDWGDSFEDGELYHEGWGQNKDFITDWLTENKPLSVEYEGRWRKTKSSGYERIANV